MMMQNVVEEAARAVYTSLRERHSNYCGCELCQEDVMALVLNQTRARYVGNPVGAAVTRVNMDSHQMQAELAVVILDAMRRVDQAPRHPRDKGSARAAH